MKIQQPRQHIDIVGHIITPVVLQLQRQQRGAFLDPSYINRASTLRKLLRKAETVPKSDIINKYHFKVTLTNLIYEVQINIIHGHILLTAFKRLLHTLFIVGYTISSLIDQKLRSSEKVAMSGLSLPGAVQTIAKTAWRIDRNAF